MKSLRTAHIRMLSLSALSIAPLLLAATAHAAPISPDKTIDVPPPNMPYKPPAPKFSPPPSDGFRWSAEARAPKWVQAWRPLTWPEGDKAGKTEQIYDPDYVHPKAFNINVTGCVDQADWDLNQANKPTKRTYTWTANGKSVTMNRCNTTLTFPAQGSYPVSLSINGQKAFNQSVRVKDILIVALGDSMSSGEGSPDTMQFLGSPYRPAGWVDRQCHRSKSGPAAQAAMNIEAMDPQTSVTFISFACSGATLDTKSPLTSFTFNAYVGNEAVVSRDSGTGVLGPFIGIESTQGEHVLSIPDYAKKGGVGIKFSQVDQMKNALAGKRRADVVVMSAGINDANFASMMATCALYSDCPKEGVGGGVEGKMPLEKRFARDADKIAAMYGRLGKEITPISNRVMVFQYPNAFTGDNKKTCDETLEDAAFGFMPSPLRLGITAFEANWIQNFAGPRVHASIKNGTSMAGFDFLEGAWEAFRGHGYCASQANRWFNRAVESNNQQGPSLTATKGTIHPNFSGYHELSKLIVKDLTGKGSNEAPRPSSDTYAASKGKVLSVDAVQGVLMNDIDTDIIASLSVKTFTQPSSKIAKVVVQPDGSFTYTPGTFVGSDSFFYTVTDGMNERIGRVVINVSN